jgi:archaellum component FlaC
MENDEFQRLVLLKLGEIDSIKADLPEVNQKVGSIDQKVGSIEQKVGSLELKVDNLTILMEQVSRNVKDIADDLCAHTEQNDRQFDELKEVIMEENELLKSLLSREYEEESFDGK